MISSVDLRSDSSNYTIGFMQLSDLGLRFRSDGQAAVQHDIITVSNQNP